MHFSSTIFIRSVFCHFLEPAAEILRIRKAEQDSSAANTAEFAKIPCAICALQEFCKWISYIRNRQMGIVLSVYFFLMEMMYWEGVTPSKFLNIRLRCCG